MFILNKYYIKIINIWCNLSTFEHFHCFITKKFINTIYVVYKMKNCIILHVFYEVGKERNQQQMSTF